MDTDEACNKVCGDRALRSFSTWMDLDALRPQIDAAGRLTQDLQPPSTVHIFTRFARVAYSHASAFR